MSLKGRQLGKDGPIVPEISLGCMGMTAFYGTDPATTEAESLAAIRKYVELCSAAGLKAHLDTAFIYAHPSGAHNEALVGKALAEVGRDKVFLATKFGVDATSYKPTSAPEAIRAQLATSLARLGTDHVDLYYQHRADPGTPIESVMATLKELVAEGKVKHVGLSECTPDELRRACAVHPVAAIQMEYSLQTRDIEGSVLPVARELGVAVVAYSPLGRGFLSSTFTKLEDLSTNDWRRQQPRFSAERFEKNAAKAAALKALADRKGCTPAQLALAWLLRRGEDIIPIPGTKSAARIVENCGASDVAAGLSGEELAEVEACVPEAEGERYAGMHGTFNTRL